MVLPFVRPMVTGATPLHLLEKPTSGTGGTLLAHLTCYPALGVFPTSVSQPPDESEWRRCLLSWLRDSPTVILIDNLSTVESSAFASVLTSTTYQDRVVGTSDTLVVGVENLWIATANNPKLSRELLRRSVRCRLDAGVEQPDLRRDFRHPDIRKWVIESRSLLIWALLTLAQAWITEGQPKGSVRLGSFESWSEVIGGILEVGGIPGFLGNREELRQSAGEETPGLEAFIHAWGRRHLNKSVGTSELWPLRGELDLGNGKEHSQRVRFGILLDSLRDRRFGTFQVFKAGTYQGAQRYRLVNAGNEERVM
jgi:hypothetical protein